MNIRETIKEKTLRLIVIPLMVCYPILQTQAPAVRKVYRKR